MNSSPSFEDHRFRPIEREQIDQVPEQDFGQSGRVDAKTAASIGKILGVDFLVMGRHRIHLKSTE